MSSKKPSSQPPVEIADLVERAADAVVGALDGCADWGASGLRVGQYASDLVADAAAHAVLDEAGVGVLSEESGLVRPGADVVVVIDPLDGSTNASRSVSWWATSVCAFDADGPVAAVVHDLVHGRRYRAVRGGGASCDGEAIAPSGVREPSEAMVGISGLPPRALGWRQFRALGAAALDLCAVADGRLDAYVDCSPDAHGVWDYAGAWLVCQEAGASVVDAHGRDLSVLDHSARRTPVAAATAQLCAAMNANRARAFATGPIATG
ncbi:MAG: inositol monophosphatase [Actinobacteria bacterium]|nr:inositol monophosphatase [Actinomycetota bacterium]